jgi:hypothetical protein
MATSQSTPQSRWRPRAGRWIAATWHLPVARWRACPAASVLDIRIVSKTKQPARGGLPVVHCGEAQRVTGVLPP